MRRGGALSAGVVLKGKTGVVLNRKNRSGADKAIKG
jgi:hypothetical protein